MTQRFLLIAVVALLPIIAASPNRAADNDASGTMFYQSCMAAASIMEGNARDDALDKAPMCFGAITAIINLEPFIKQEYAMCPPTESKISYAQMILVVVSYLKNHPEQLDRNFHMLALTALNTAWPCSKAPVTCSEVFQNISRPLEMAFGAKSLVWANVMVLAGCLSGKPEEITTKSRLEAAAILARTLCRETGHDNCY
jgi:hypothetical protein